MDLLIYIWCCCCSVAKSLFDSLWPHGLQHPRLSCPSLSAAFCSNSCPLSSDVIQPSHPLSPSSPPALNPSQHQGLFQWVGSSIRWPRYQIFSFSISPPSEYSELISFRIDWFHLLVAQGTLKNVLQHHSLRASVLKHSAFLMVQLSHVYTTTGKTIALARQTFVSKVMSLLFNTLSGLS